MEHKREAPDSPIAAIHNFAATLTHRVRELDEMEREYKIMPGDATKILSDMIEAQVYAIFRTMYMHGSATEKDKAAALEAMKVFETEHPNFAQEYMGDWKTPTKVVVITNHVSHIKTVLGLNPNNPNLIIITPESTDKLHGRKDFYYYPMRPLYAREQQLIEANEGKSINKTELFELIGMFVNERA